jgi:hypothetical protein
MQTKEETPNNLSILFDIYRMAQEGGLFSTSHLSHIQIYSLAQDLSHYNRLHILNKTESAHRSILLPISENSTHSVKAENAT